MNGPLYFSAPQDMLHTVVKTAGFISGSGFRIPFATSLLVQWGTNKENYIQEQAYVRDGLGVVLISISVQERTVLPIECAGGFNAMQYSLKSDAVAYMKGHGYLPLLEKTYTMQYVPKGNHVVWLERGDYLFLYFIISDDQMGLMTDEHTHLAELLYRIRAACEDGIMLNRMGIDAACKPILSRLEFINLKGTQLNLEISGLIKDALLVYNEHLHSESANISPSHPRDYACQMKAYVAEHLFLPVPRIIAGLKLKFFLEEKTLERYWQKESGKPLRTWLAEKRMLCSLYILCSENIKVGKVSSILGYEAESSFSKAFTQYFGFSPRYAQEYLKPKI